MSGDLKEVIKTCEYWRKKFQVGCTSNVKAGMNMVCSVKDRKANNKESFIGDKIREIGGVRL